MRIINLEKVRNIKGLKTIPASYRGGIVVNTYVDDMVEMAGVEPASERIDPRIYYECSSFIDFILRRKKEQNLLRLFTQTRKSSFVPRRESMDSILTL